MAALLLALLSLLHPHPFDVHFKRAWAVYFRDVLPEKPWWLWFKAQGLAENRKLDPTAVAPDSGMGIMQIDPRTARWRRIPWQSILEPRTNIFGGVSYDRWIWNYLQRKVPPFGSRKDHLLISFVGYNAGPGNAEKAKRMAKAENCDDGKIETVAKLLLMITGMLSKITELYIQRIQNYHKELWSIEFGGKKKLFYGAVENGKTVR